METPDVVIVGLGYIGLPTAALLTQNGLYVHGVDVNPTVVETINRGEIHIVESDLEEVVKQAVEKGYLRADIKPVESSTFIIVVPTPFKGKNEPDISFVLEATQAIIPFLKKGDTIILESTSPIGTTEKVFELILANKPDLKDEIYISYCPERVLPGNVLYELVNNDRVIGGINEQSTKKAIEFYKTFVKGELHSTNSRTAEMCKLVENASRDVQIAFANELSLICDKADIDVWELIKLANKHPRVNILNPGSGVGGHCIAVDPYFIVSDYPLESKIIGAAREINNYKSFWCAEKVKTAKLEFELKHGRKPKVALFGLAFKPNIDDLRESPAKYIVQKILQSSNNDLHFIIEPNIKQHSVFKLTSYTKAAEQADILVFLVAHKEFKTIETTAEQIVLDFCGIKSI